MAIRVSSSLFSALMVAAKRPTFCVTLPQDKSLRGLAINSITETEPCGNILILPPTRPRKSACEQPPSGSAVKRKSETFGLERRRPARFPAEMIHLVMAGLVPAIPTEEARPCQLNRDRRDKPGDDDSVLAESALGLGERQRLGGIGL